MKLLPLVLLLIWWIASTLIRKVSESPRRSDPPRSVPTTPGSQPQPWNNEDIEKLEKQLYSWLEIDEEVEKEEKEEKKEEKKAKSIEETKDDAVFSPPPVEPVRPKIAFSHKGQGNVSQSGFSHPLQRLTREQLMQAVVMKEVLDLPLSRRPQWMRRSIPVYRDQGRSYHP